MQRRGGRRRARAHDDSNDEQDDDDDDDNVGGLHAHLATAGGIGMHAMSSAAALHQQQQQQQQLYDMGEYTAAVYGRHAVHPGILQQQQQHALQHQQHHAVIHSDGGGGGGVFDDGPGVDLGDDGHLGLPHGDGHDDGGLQGLGLPSHLGEGLGGEDEGEESDGAFDRTDAETAMRIRRKRYKRAPVPASAPPDNGGDNDHVAAAVDGHGDGQQAAAQQQQQKVCDRCSCTATSAEGCRRHAVPMGFGANKAGVLYATCNACLLQCKRKPLPAGVARVKGNEKKVSGDRFCATEWKPVLACGCDGP